MSILAARYSPAYPLLMITSSMKQQPPSKRIPPEAKAKDLKFTFLRLSLEIYRGLYIPPIQTHPLRELAIISSTTMNNMQGAFLVKASSLALYVSTLVTVSGWSPGQYVGALSVKRSFSSRGTELNMVHHSHWNIPYGRPLPPRAYFPSG